MAVRLNRPVITWLLLVCLTLTSVGVFEGDWLGALSTLVIVLIAGIKAHMVMMHFMEAAHAPGRWRLLYETWVFAAAALIAIGHYVTLARLG